MMRGDFLIEIVDDTELSLLRIKKLSPDTEASF